MKYSLVTGGAGFLGSHLCDYLIDKGHFVVCMDNLITGSPDNIAHLIGNEKFKFISHDVTEFIYVAKDLDYIFHFASPASPIDYLKLPIQTLKVGSLGTHKALGLAKVKECSFLLASTSECYGDPLVHPQSEDYWGNVNPIGPRGVYDEAKRFAEALTMAYHRHHGIDAKIARIFNTYGSKMRLHDGRALPEFMVQAITGADLTVFGDGLQTRSFCYIDDMVRGIYKLMMSGENEPVNLGNPNEISILDFAKTVIKFTGSSSKIVFKELPIDDPKVRQPDIKKAKRTLDWEPEVDLTDGIQNTIPYFVKKIKEDKSAD